ncbi:MAG: hypothetical protein IKI29_00160 [Clostridia bacterium]|nr:hypothetical protein [Clostridia bacterium]
MDETIVSEETESRQKLHPLLGITYCEVLCLVLLFSGLMVIKLFFPDCFSTIRKAYEERFCVETSVQEILDALPETQAEIFHEV